MNDGDPGTGSPVSSTRTIAIHTHDRRDLTSHLPRWEAFVARRGQVPLSWHPAWLLILERGLQQVPYCLEAVEGPNLLGFMALAYVKSLLFGRFLVSLPYLNYGGVVADDPEAARRLIDRAVQLADELKVRYLELRHEQAIEHPALLHRTGHKVNMRLPLPATSKELWDRIPAKVRNQVRKGQKSGLTISWGGEELLADFYAVFSRNMRDLGTPVFGRELFRSTVQQFPDRSEFCVVRTDQQPVAAALLLHGWQITEVPSASSLRAFNSTCANMLMYWHLLERAVERGQGVFDFGRSSPDSSTFQFKKQWGAQPVPAEWQSYTREGTAAGARPETSKYQRLVRMWQRMPLGLSRLLGPWIVRGIP